MTPRSLNFERQDWYGGVKRSFPPDPARLAQIAARAREHDIHPPINYAISLRTRIGDGERGRPRGTGPRPVVCSTTGEKYPHARAAARAIGMPQSTFAKRMGIDGVAKGMKFQYVVAG